ncbi:ras GEF [Backusella circina FSU 941]|nr:ras GEF [Backusella circina FSU 941]
MIDRQQSPSPWSQTMSRIHSPLPDNDSIKSEMMGDSHFSKGTTKLMPLQDESSSLPPRKRNNSLIPIELMINNSSEGVRECAALATVFGVREYTESKVFWERQQQANEITPKRLQQTSARHDVTVNDGNNSLRNQQYGYVSVNNISIMSKPLSSSPISGNDITENENNSQFAISSYVDSILGHVASEEALKPTFPKSASSPIPTITKAFSLPQIPTVSRFNDFLIEDEHGTELMFPANPSSILIHSLTPMLRQKSGSSVASTFSLHSHQNNTSDNLCTDMAPLQSPEEIDEYDLNSSKLVIIIGTPEIFDFITSDSDERFIIWGPDPIVLSSSMATTSAVPERPSSYATLYNNQHARPELKGFSSNATSTLARSRSNGNLKKPSRPGFGSVRWSAQSWSENIRFKPIRPSINATAHQDNELKGPSRLNTSSFLLKKAFGLNKEKDAQTGPVQDIPEVIEAATVYKLVEKLTSTLDYTFMTDFFLTYRDFLKSEDLCQLLIIRFQWALESDEEARRVVRIRTFVVLRHWLNNYFVHDFIGNQPLRLILTEFLNQLPKHPLVQKSPRDQRIVKILKRVVRRLKKLYYARSSGAARVHVIAPPPPTEEQAQMGEMVRAKLSQNAIRRKTTIGVGMSSHHNGNMAVQDARYATVVVVGSLPNAKGSLLDSGVESSYKNSLVPLRRNLSQYSTPSHEVTSSTIPLPQAHDETCTLPSSIQHRYNKNVNDSNEGAPVDASSIVSVASDDSLISDISAGQTIPDESDEDDDDHSHINEYYVEENEHDLYWQKEQQETMEYFNSIAKGSVENAVDANIKEVNKDDTMSPAVLSSGKRASIPLEFLNYEISEGISSSSPPPISAEEEINTRSIRRVPSERWCKNADGDENQKSSTNQTVTNILPVELCDEMSGDEAKAGKIPTGLSRKLSRKSIERRRSERSLRDLASQSSSTATSPYLTSQSLNDASDIPEVPPLPEMLETSNSSGVASKKSIIKKRSGLLKKKPSQVNSPTDSAIDTFASIPYENTSTTPTEQQLNDASMHDNSHTVTKRSLTKALSKVFGGQKSNDIVKETAEIHEANDVDKFMPANENEAEKTLVEEKEQEEEKTHFVSLIARQLRNDEDEDENQDDFEKCNCRKCSGNRNGPERCRRLSVLMISDNERRHSFELRRRRGASIDAIQGISLKDILPEEETLLKEERNRKEPMYLGHLQAREMVMTKGNPQNKKMHHHTEDSEDDSDSDDRSTVSYAPTEKSIRTEAQASSSRVRLSMISDVAMPGHRSKLIELGIPPSMPGHQLIDPTSNHSMVDQYAYHQIVNHPNSTKGYKSFIMAYRTSLLASQFCFIERDVLVKVGWEELIHCKWTKMDANGKVNSDNFQDLEGDDYIEDGINYTRESEKRRTQEQGIELVIQRFNQVCQWVSSEIVRTKNLKDRVKLIEKFIRLAQKCKMYSNYATLVQILLGLQSPSVARLEKTWSKVSAKCQKQLGNLTEFTSPMKNWKNIRDSMTEVAEEYGNSPAEVQVEMPGTTAHKQKFKKTRIKIPFGGCIPFLGIYLSDLVFNSEKPRYLKPNSDASRIYNANNTKQYPLCLNQPLVNFRKHRVIATVIKRVLIFQGLATRYSFDADGFLLDRCRNLEVLNISDIREMSSSLE